MTVSSPPTWSDPAGGTVDLNSGPWTAAAVDAICSDLAVLGGTDGKGGVAGRPNLLANGGFEVWQRGAGPWGATNAYTADRWQLQVGTSTVSATKETGNVAPAASAAALKLAYTFAAGGSCSAVQSLEHFLLLRGLTVSCSLMVYSSVPGVVLQIADGAGVANSAASVLTNGWETLAATRLVSGGATLLQVKAILPGASCVVYLDNAMLTPGGSPNGYVPLPTADELARCQRYYQQVYASARFVATAASQNMETTVAWVEKAVAPTVTVGGVTTALNLAAGYPQVPNPQTQGGSFLIQSAAGGDTQARYCLLTVQSDV